jgi:hypothetical protein
MSKQSFAELIAEDRRLAILRTLSEIEGYVLNEMVLRSALTGLGHQVDRVQCRADLIWLEQHMLVRIEKIDAPTSGELWLTHLREAGQAVARGKYHPGVARLEAD